MLPFRLFLYTSSTQVPAVLVILVFLVCDCTCKQVVNGAQDPPGSLHTIVWLVEWSSLKGRSLWWFTIRKTSCFTKMPLVTISGHVISLMLLFSLLFLALHYCFFLYIFFLLWLLLWLLNFYQVLFHGRSFSEAPFSPECCFFWPFLWPFLPSSSWWLVFSTP